MGTAAMQASSKIGYERESDWGQNQLSKAQPPIDLDSDKNTRP